MASHLIASAPWAPGTTVSVYAADAIVAGQDTPTGTPVTSAVVDAGQSVTFMGLTQGVRYLAYAGGVARRFLIPHDDEPLDGIRARLDQLVETEVLRGADSAHAQPAIFLGNAPQSEFDSEANMPIQVEVYFGLGSSPRPLTGRPQARRSQAKFGGPTTADSAQAASDQSVLVASAVPQTQTFPQTGGESDAIAQDNWTVTGQAVGHSFVVEAQGTAHYTKSRPVYIAAKAAKDAASLVDDWVGIYIEDPSTGSAGTITDKAGIHSKPRIQTESGVIIGVPQANLTAAIRGTTLYVNGTNPSGSVGVKIVKKAGSTDDVLQIADSAALPQIIVNQNGQLIVKTSNTTHTNGSAVGAMIAQGDITTPPSANYSGGGGFFQYSVSGKPTFRTGAGNIITLAGALAVSGSRAGNAALASLLTQLAATGLIVDGTAA